MSLLPGAQAQVDCCGFRPRRFEVRRLVPGVGIEPTRPRRSADFKSAASADFATPAYSATAIDKAQNPAAGVLSQQSSRLGGDDRIRTGDRGFADPCLNHLATSPQNRPIRPCSRSWCRGGDLNPYARRHGPLKTACLPIPPPRPQHTTTKSRRLCSPAPDFSLAGVEGLEPPTGGFGDRCSAD
jgi:hypothetical protein